MRKVVLFITIFFLLSSGFSLTYYLKSIKDTGYPGENLVYQLLIKNDENTTVPVHIFFPTAQNIYVSMNNFNLLPGEDATVNITYSIPITAQPGSYLFPIRINGEDTNMHLSVTILRPLTDYSRIKISDVRVNSIDPRNGGILTVYIQNPVEGTSGKITFYSSFGNQTKDIYIPVGSSKTSFNIKIPVKTSPGDYPYQIILIVKGIKNVYNGTLNVLGYTICNVKKTEDSNIFFDKVKYVLTNNGTKEGICTVKTVLSGGSRIFLGRISPGYKRTDDTFVWEKSIKPGQKIVISYEIDYYGIYIAVAVAIIAGIAYWYFSRVIIVKKSLIDYKRGRGFMDLKIQIRIKNNKNRTIKNLTILEHIPPLIREVKEFGTMKGEIEKIKGKRYIKWKLEEIKPKEEIFLSYKVRTSLEVIGELMFDPTKVKWKENGKEKTSDSNVLVIAIE